MEHRTSLFENGMIWFGAGVSIAEVLTGTYFAPLGFRRGLLAIFLGHAIGCTLLFLSGLIGAKTGRSSMEAVKGSFGSRGGLLFAVLNILQLVGWTSIMIYDGALAAGGIFAIGHGVWCLIIGGLILLWVFAGITNVGKLNAVVVTALFLLTLVLAKLIFGGGTSVPNGNAGILSFGAAVELAAAMPISWLPLISDYTHQAKDPVKATGVSVAAYGCISCWMYIIGMGAALFTGESDIARILGGAGLGMAGLFIVVCSTVVTTFLDTYSAGASCEAIFPVNGKRVGIAVAVIGMTAAMFLPMDNITGFLYLIGSVFAPMIAIQIADNFLLHRDSRGKTVDRRNLILWLVGFVLYRILMQFDLPCGNTLPDMAVTVLLCLLFRGWGKKGKLDFRGNQTVLDNDTGNLYNS